MKKILSKIIFITLSLPLLVSAQSLNFGNTFTISSGADGYGRPRIALTNNQPIIIWRKDSICLFNVRVILWLFIFFYTQSDFNHNGCCRKA